MKRATLTNRIRLLTAVIVLVALIIIGRLYNLQVMNAEAYEDRAAQQYVHTARDLYSRGSIYFTTKDGEQLSAASIQSGYVLAVNPTHVTDPEEFCTALEPYLDGLGELCVTRASLPNRTYVELVPDLSDAQAEEIIEADIDGALLYKNQWRYYPGGTVAARSVGFVGYHGEETEVRGKFGLERHYDDVLYQEDETLSVNFFAELFSNLGERVYDNDARKTGDIVTTLEPAVSRLLDTVLEETNDRFNSRLTGAIIMDPDTGAIYAMNVVPELDLNNRSSATIEQFKNPLVEDLYEMGSIIKPLTVAAGLDAGVITPDTTYYDPGCIELNTFTICNYDGGARGTVDMQQVLNQSLNTGVAHIVNEMGRDSFREYFLSYKLGSETGVDLPNEAFGLVSNLNSPREVEYATASFGQGIALTPVATVRALATLANGGRLITPHLVSHINYDDGSSKEIRYPEGEQVLSEETSEEVSRMLQVVVDDALRGGDVALTGHTVGAKTGTAQIADPVNGGYYEDKFLHSFFGYFPVYDPEFLVFLYTVEPEGVRYASETLTDPFMQITRFLINYYSIPPDR
jgi:cell division protein FtsI/penicillin-binding protein 2